MVWLSKFESFLHTRLSISHWNIDNGMLAASIIKFLVVSINKYLNSEFPKTSLQKLVIGEFEDFPSIQERISRNQV